MTIKTESGIYTIELRYWEGGWNAGFTPDCFDDLEVNFPMEHPHEYDDDYRGNVIVTTDADLKGLVDWWENECASANEGEGGDCLGVLTAEERDRDEGWVLEVKKEL